MPPKKTNKAIAQARFLKESKNPALDIAKKGKIAKNIDSYHPQQNDWKGVDTPGSKLPSKKRKAPPKSSVPVAKKVKKTKTAKKATGKKPVKKAPAKKAVAPKKKAIPKPPKKKLPKAPAKPVKPKPAPIAAVSEAVKSVFSPIPTAPPMHVPPGWEEAKKGLGVDGYPYRIQFKTYKDARCGFYLRDGKYLMDGEYWEDYYGPWKVSDMANVKGGKYNLFQKMPGEGLNRYAMQKTLDGKKWRVIDLMSFSVETAAEKADYPRYGTVKMNENAPPYSFDKVMLDWIAGTPEPLDQVTKDWKSFVATTPQYWSVRPSGELTVFRGHHDVPDLAKTKVGALKKFTSDRPTSWSSNVCVSTRFADGGGYNKKQKGYVLMMRVPVDRVVADLRFLDPQFVTGIIGALEDEVIVKPGIYPTEVIWTTKKKGKPKHVFELLKTNATY